MTTPTSPNEHGVEVPDMHWLLTLRRSQEFSTTVNGVHFPKVNVVTARRVDYDVWRQAPDKKFATRMKMLRGLMSVGIGDVMRWWIEDVWLGRRCNDEIEMFEEGMKPEYKTLRADLRALGLTVRPFVKPPTSPTSRFPVVSYKAILGTDTKNENTHMARSLKSLAKFISNCEAETGVKIEYGLLGTVPGNNKFILAIARVLEEDADLTSLTRIDHYKGTLVVTVIGRIRDGVPTFDDGVKEEVVKDIFDSLGRVVIGTKVLLIDRIKEMENEDKQAMIARKKEAKKARRRAGTLATSTVTTSSAVSASAGVADDDNEVAKARKREKAKQKKKAQRARKRDAKETEKLAGEPGEAVLDYIKQSQQQEERTENVVIEDSSSEEDIDVEGIVRATKNDKGADEDAANAYLRSIISTDADTDDSNLCLWVPHSTKFDLDQGQEPEKLGLGGEESVDSDVTEEEEEDGQEQKVEVILINTEEEARQAIRSRPGCRIATGTLEDSEGLCIQGLRL